MNHLSHALPIADARFHSLKLMFMHRNTDKILADSIGATTATTDQITVIYFHHSISYKYTGRLAANNILSSLYPYISLPPDEFPLKTLNTPQDLTSFLHSTDNALLLVDFCGWTPKLLRKTHKNGTQNGSTMNGESVSFCNVRTVCLLFLSSFTIFKNNYKTVTLFSLC